MEIKFIQGPPSISGGVLLKKIMRAFVFLCCSLAFALGTNKGKAQNADIVIDADKTLTVKQVFRLINKQTDYKFIYRHDLVKTAPEVDLKKGIIKAGELLNKTLSPINFTFAFTEGGTIIVKRKLTKLSEVATPQLSNEDLQFNVSGTVVDQDGTPLPGANVIEKGTTNGVQSDFDGNFSISVADENSSLVVSYIGYAAKEISIKGQTSLNVVLEESAAGLDEVVVVGYGTQLKKDITGSVSSISTNDLESVPINNAQQFIQGRAAGIQVQQTGGDLDGKFSILIRGVNSTGTNGPLYVVDGIPLANDDISTINPNDIASLDILKDASASAIYGARASNGVVVITTKTGRKGKSSLNLEVKNGLEEDIKRLDVFNTAELLEFSEQAYINNGQNWPGITPELAQNDNDWQDLMLQTGIWNEYSLSASGGNDKTNFLISGSYLYRKGILIGTDFERYSFRINLDHEFSSKFKMGVRLTNSKQNQEVAINDARVGSGFRTALLARPWNPYKDEDGNFIGIPNRSAPNNGPMDNYVAVNLEEIRQRDVGRVLGNIYGEYEILEDLKFKLNFGVDLSNNNNYTYLPVYDRGGFRRTEGVVIESNSRNVNYVVDYTLNYDKSFGKHNVTGLLGSSFQEFGNNFFSVNATGTTNNLLDQISNQTNITNANGGETNSAILSYFGRLNYGFDDKYLLTATVRRDGSSRFGSINKFGTFPSGSVAWRISEEDFMKDVKAINDFKLRASYGLTGNQAIANFQFLATTTASNAVFGDAQVGGVAPNSFANTEVQWETNKQLDLGFDLSLFSNRLSISADYYDKRSEDLLVVIPKPPSTGIDADPTVNLGSISNKGFDFAVNSYNVVSDNFNWSTSLNFSTNKNEVIDIGKNALGESSQIPGEEVAPFQGGIPINLTTAGQPIGAFFTLEFDGIFQESEAAEAALFGLEPGDAKYVDQNGDGIINPDDRIWAGQPNPKFYGGMTNDLNYKDLTLSIFVNWQYGNKIFNQLGQYISSGHPAINALDVPYWTPENQSNEYPRPLNAGRAFNYNAAPSTRFLEDGDFIRLKNVSLSYDFPETIADKIGFDIRLGLSATNLITITDYTGLDPENNSSGFQEVSILSSGFDSTPYPLARTYMLSLNLGF